jgi:hypothetical protein
MHSIAGDSDAITAAIVYGFAILGYQIHQFQTSLDAAPGLLPAEGLRPNKRIERKASGVG